MTIHIHRSFELSIPVTNARALLIEQPPFDGEQLGTYWLWHGDLWTITLHRFDDGRLLWRGICPARPDALLVLSATLRDATIATHVDLHLAAQIGGVGALIREWRLRSTIERQIDARIARLRQAAIEGVPPPIAPTTLPDDPAALAETLRPTHPETVAAFESIDGLADLAAVARLDARWRATEAGAFSEAVYTRGPLPPIDASYDLIYAGGGLGLLHAAVMARRYGYRVLLFDRGEVGCAHREWNISDEELQALVRIGLFTSAELERVIMRRYHDGIVRFLPDNAAVRASDLHLPNVLNVAIDAAGLLQMARHKLTAAGGMVLDYRSFRRVVCESPGAIVVETEYRGRTERFGARLLLDGMGSTSPLALRRFAGQPFAGVCPTVGTVVTGLERGDAPDQHNPDRGDILISIADTQRDRQLIWEGFAGRDDELTVYVFYYDLLRNHGSARTEARTDDQRLCPQPPDHSLLDLFEDYFRLLPTYKRPGPEFRHAKPVYGFIPARHTERRLTVPLLPGVLPIGDSSAQQSPLTFCGFGSHVRNLDRTTSLLDQALRRDLLDPDQLGLISAYQSNVALNWVFSRFMQPWRRPQDVNRLQNIFARVLNDLGVEVAVRFFRDQMTWRDYGRIVNHTLKVYKPIIPTALEVLGPRECARWVLDWLRFSRSAALAAAGRSIGGSALDTLETQLDRAAPKLAFRVRATRAEWQVMGWTRAAAGPPIGTPQPRESYA